MSEIPKKRQKHMIYFDSRHATDEKIIVKVVVA